MTNRLCAKYVCPLKKKPLQLFHDKPGKNPDYSLINIWLGHPCSTRPPLAPKMVLFARYHLESSMYSTRLSHGCLFLWWSYKAGRCYCLTSLMTYDINTHSCFHLIAVLGNYASVAYIRL